MNITTVSGLRGRVVRYQEVQDEGHVRTAVVLLERTNVQLYIPYAPLSVHTLYETADGRIEAVNGTYDLNSVTGERCFEERVRTFSDDEFPIELEMRTSA